MDNKPLFGFISPYGGGLKVSPDWVLTFGKSIYFGFGGGGYVTLNISEFLRQMQR